MDELGLVVVDTEHIITFMAFSHMRCGILGGLAYATLAGSQVLQEEIMRRLGCR
jgi:hypothetical protein